MKISTFFRGFILSLLSIFIVLYFFTIDIKYNYSFCIIYLPKPFFKYLIGSIFEELLFRVILLELLSRETKLFISIFLQALIFSLAHFMQGIEGIALIGYFIGGLNYGMCYLMYRSLYSLELKNLVSIISYPVGLHFAWNFCQFAIFGLPIDRIKNHNSLFNVEIPNYSLYTGSFAGFEGGQMQIISRILILLFLIYEFRKVSKIKIELTKK